MKYQKANTYLIGAVLLCLGFSFGSGKSDSLDLSKAHEFYNNGEFEKAIQTIEAFSQSHPNPSRQDSIFISKHLAVIYLADPETRERGKYYTYQLLGLNPTEELIDMFVSEEIEEIFSKVRKEYLYNQPRTQASENLASAETANASPDSTPSEGNRSSFAESQSGNASVKSVPDRRKEMWLVGASAVVGMGIVTLVYLNGRNESSGTDYNLDMQNP